MKNLSKSTLVFFFSLLSFSSIAQSKNDTSALFKKLDEYIISATNAEKFNGSVLIAKKGEIILQKGYGWKNFSDHTLNSPNTISQIGSLTKSFTAMVILKLQEEGKLSVNDRLYKYLPEQKDADKITIQNMLDHTSGIDNYTDIIGPEDSAIFSHPVSKQRILDVFEKKHLAFKPGSKYEYCNSDYFLLGMIIEKLTGKSYEQAVRQLIFEPLKMNHSGFDFINLKDSSKAEFYVTIGSNKYIKAPKVDSTVTYAAGAIYSTTGDLYKWAKAIAENQILSDSSWKQAFTPHLAHYGDGWWIDTLYSNKYVMHSGGFPGFMSNFMYYPEMDVTIILPCNFGNYGGSLGDLTSGVSAILFDKPYSPYEKHTKIRADKTLLKQYAGVYRFNSDHQLIITFNGGKLFVEDSNPKDMLPKVELHAESETMFYISEAQLKFEFIKDASGNSQKIITYNTRGKDAEWVKEK
ncbi:MAG: class beta-lactamase-related serine hydrolase [Mucilaginibacter sp.]|nr:class beta-lactamase-related serine hydrolase [Mucilaginibacter sp.]